MSLVSVLLLLRLAGVGSSCASGSPPLTLTASECLRCSSLFYTLYSLRSVGPKTWDSSTHLHSDSNTHTHPYNAYLAQGYHGFELEAVPHGLHPVYAHVPLLHSQPHTRTNITMRTFMFLAGGFKVDNGIFTLKTSKRRPSWSPRGRPPSTSP